MAHSSEEPPEQGRHGNRSMGQPVTSFLRLGSSGGCWCSSPPPPFDAVQDPQPMERVPPTFRVGLPTLPGLEASQTQPEVCLLGDTRAYQVDSG